MADPQASEAYEALANVPEYQWLTDSEQAWWTTAEVAERMGVSAHVVRGWCDSKQIKGAILYERQVGWRMPRSGLLEFFARLQQGERHIG